MLSQHSSGGPPPGDSPLWVLSMTSWWIFLFLKLPTTNYGMIAAPGGGAITIIPRSNSHPKLWAINKERGLIVAACRCEQGVCVCVCVWWAHDWPNKESARPLWYQVRSQEKTHNITQRTTLPTHAQYRAILTCGPCTQSVQHCVALKWRETKLINSHQNTTTCIISGTTIYYSTNHKVSISICTQQSGHAGKSQGNHKRGRTNTHTCTLFQSTTYYIYTSLPIQSHELEKEKRF